MMKNLFNAAMFRKMVKALEFDANFVKVTRSVASEPFGLGVPML